MRFISKLMKIKFKRWLCQVIGHTFNGYYTWPDQEGVQHIPTHFICNKCRMIIDVKEGWN